MRIEWMEYDMARAERFITENQVDEGLLILNNLLFEEPGYGSLHNHLGWAHFYFTGDWTKAELHFQMAIKFDSNFAPAYLHLGNLYNRKELYSMAIEKFNTGLQLQNANKPAFLEGIAQAYEMKRAFGRAIKFYKEAIATSAGFEVDRLRQGIKRCRTKRWVLLLS